MEMEFGHVHNMLNLFDMKLKEDTAMEVTQTQSFEKSATHPLCSSWYNTCCAFNTGLDVAILKRNTDFRPLNALFSGRY